MFDFIIIGAGAAGSLVADRLSADGRRKILVLEAGGSDRKLFVQMPIGYGRTFSDASVNWKYYTLPQAGLNQRAIYWPRGRVLGGSSSINAMVHMRGLPSDYDHWAAQGNDGWAYDDVRPIFERLEQQLEISDMADQLHESGQVWQDAARELGLPETDDFNGPHPAGLGHYRFNIKNGRRHSAADVFLKPALARKNLQLELNAQVTALHLDGARVCGVRYIRHGRMQDVTGAHVILCGGAVNSPQLLQLSGIGPGAVLQAAGIPVRSDLPAVGHYLQDHLGATYTFEAKRPTVNDQLNSWVKLGLHGLRYILSRTGVMAQSVNQFGGLVATQPGSTMPDTQLYFNPISYGSGATATDGIQIDPFSGFILCYQPSRPTSRGSILIQGPDVLAPPAIDPNYVSTAEDEMLAISGGRFLQKLRATKAFEHFTARDLPPSLAGLKETEILADFRARASTVYHPVGTCRMGGDPANSVVDQNLAVRGIAGLYVADASIFPSIPSANTQAPTLMAAWRGAEIIQKHSAR
jgi:choline dehydrogenase